MKIVSIHINSFGKFKNADFKFNSGLNILQQHNGFGKTTLATFIRAMLYGFKKSSKFSKFDADNASSWSTWNSTELSGGTMVVEHNGTLLRIERTFGATPKGNAVSFTEEKTGKVVNTELSVGEYLLGLDVESYDRSTFIPQEAVSIGATDNFESRLAGLVQNAEDYKKVCKSLADYQSELSSTRAKFAVIPTLENKRMRLQMQLNECAAAKKRQEQINLRLVQISQESELLDSEIAQLNGKLEALQKKNAQMQPTAEQLENLNKLHELEEKLSRLGDLPKDKETCDLLAEKIEQTPEVAKVQRPISLPLLICGIVLVLAGVGVCFAQLFVGIALCVVGLALSVTAFFVKPALKTLPSGERDALITQFFNIASKYVFCANKSYQEVQKLLWQVYFDYSGDLRVCEMLKKSVVQPQPNVDDVQAELELLRNQLAQAQQRKQNLSQEVGSLSEESKRLNTDSLPISEQLEEIELQLAQAKRKMNVATKVLELLAEAKENLSTSYLPKLCTRCCELFNTVADNNWEIVVNRNFSLQLRTGTVTKPLDCFSRGTRELVLLCFRIALSELLFDGQIPFLLVDDALVNLDEENFLRATQLLKELSKQTQVLYFTCHNRLGKLR